MVKRVFKDNGLTFQELMESIIGLYYDGNNQYQREAGGKSVTHKKTSSDLIREVEQA